MSNEKVKIEVFCPTTHSDELRKVIGNAGGGKIGNYSHCTFSTIGTGRFLPLSGSNPAIGQHGILEEVVEEKIEFICYLAIAKKVIAEIKANHPYEEVAYFVTTLTDL